MNIQSGYDALAYQGADRIGISKLSAATTKSMSVDGVTAQGSSASTTQVSISDAARKLASQERTPMQGRTALQEQLLKSTASDPQSTEKMAYDFANVPSQIAYDISDQIASGKCGPVNKLASTGRFVDDTFKATFSKDASLIDSHKKAIYETEKAKGTPAAEIIAKIIDFTNLQPRDYLEATGWLGKSSA